MSPAAVLRQLPALALAAGAASLVLAIVWSALRRGLARRPILLVASLLGVTPAVFVSLVTLRVIPEAYLRIGHPYLTLALGAASLFVSLRLAGREARVSPRRRRLTDLLVSLATLAAGLAATAPELGRPLDRLTIVVVVDRSRSIDLVTGAATRVKRELAFAEEGMREEDLIGTVVFGTHAATEDFPRPKSDLPSPQQVDIGRDGTDLAAGLKRALADVPADSAARLVLISDGVATRGDVMGAAAAAVASEIPIDVVPLDQREIPDVRVVSFRVTPRATEGETLGMRLVVSSPADAAIEIRVKRDGKLVQRLKAEVAAGEDVLTFPEPAGAAGLHRYDVEVSAVDPRLDETADDNAASAFVRVRGPARALVLDGDGGTGFLANAMSAAGFHVDEGSLSAFPTDIGAMAAYDLIAFGDIPAHALRPEQIEALASYARDLGGGLLLTGGDRSFGPGGYARTPLEEVSPVSFDLKQDKRRASLAEVIAIDISGSMGATVGGQTKLELANEAAARSA
ncbi:MAG: VWA domain-containing protein, partial [Myxococcales bacterium]|nr:VWA domain-containing protein [Myxococcales bacterium]